MAALKTDQQKTMTDEPVDPWTAPSHYFATLSLDKLMELAASGGHDQSSIGRNVYSEIKRRELSGQLAAVAAAQRAADATMEAASHTRRSATWMMWTVLITGATAVVALMPSISIAVSFLTKCMGYIK
jgi:hypothetical protein